MEDTQPPPPPADEMASPAEVAGAGPAPQPAAGGPRLWIERIQLTSYRNYASARLDVGPQPVVLCGPNGSGKTNLLEAISLLTSGQGLRRAPYAELALMGAQGWSVAARLNTPLGARDVGTGLVPGQDGGRAGRTVRIDGETQPATALGEVAEIMWVTPAMDGLFTGAASERRRFLDRLIACFEPGYGRLLNQYERAMQQRNRLLSDNVTEAQRFEGFERVMSETGVAIAAARAAAVAELAQAIRARRDTGHGTAFPWAELATEGSLEQALATEAAVDVEDQFCASLARWRERDRAVGRALDGPHRSDLIVGHGPKEMPAKVCSTGEQKALLIGLVLAHADLVSRRNGGTAPILLLDEVTAHLDPARRGALFAEILALGTQAWMSGTDLEAFSGLGETAQKWVVEDGRLERPS
ncbi:MAG: DNA replication/repair protein RecF [Hyphomicrobiaceae bacterium]|nr:DNA replication/repair protein RecF [Hyphomicrobiaceae bacterium]